jgi:hypothetical protein
LYCVLISCKVDCREEEGEAVVPVDTAAPLVAVTEVALTPDKESVINILLLLS